MPEDKRNLSPDDPGDNSQDDRARFSADDDMPFHLPLAADSGSVHEDDVDMLISPDEYASENEDTVPRSETDNIAALHASDPPLKRPADNDETLTAPQEAVEEPLAADDIQEIRPLRDDDDDENDDDVPFRLPRDPQPSGDKPIASKFATMPSDPARNQAPTIAGSGGLDPNPDFGPQPTMQSPRVQGHDRYRPPQQNIPAPTMPGGMRPVPPQARSGPPAPAQGARARPALPPRRKRRLNPGCLAIFIGVFVAFCGGLTLITGIAGSFAYARVGTLLNERIEEVDRYAAFQSTFIYDRNGRELYEVFGEGRRTNVRLSNMPQDLINATIATEDGSFYRNIGIDIPATTQAFLRFVGAGSGADIPGGSTITQQLVRNVLFEPQYRAERSARRKAEEILLALALTGRKSKDEILELYLNEIYYGNLAYGAQAAAQVYFDKDVSQLTLGEAALLAALPQAPADLNPLNPDPAVQTAVDLRWRGVLNAMVREGFIMEAQRDEALAQGLSYSSPDVPLNAPHFVVYAQTQLEQLMLDLGYSAEDIARGGLQVYTTVDLEIDEMARQAAAQQVAALGAYDISNASVLVLKPITGEILAMVGSIDYNNDAIDGHVNVSLAQRQPGSTVKAFTYAAAMERGITTGDVIWDTRTRIGIPGQPVYEPRNYDRSFHGPMTMRYALANSYNIPAVQTLRQVGVDYLLDLMYRFGVRSLGQDPSFYGLSLTLGGGDITLLELTRGFGVFANQGLLVNTQAILCVLDNDNNIIYEYENACPRGTHTTQTVSRTGLGTQVLDPRIAYVIGDILNDNTARTPAMGANSPLLTPNITTSVKTGTTDDVRDNWTVGYTRNVAVGVWVGNNDNRPMRGDTSGLTGAAPIWNQVITGIYNNPAMLNQFAVDGQLLSDQAQPPGGMSQQRICNVRSLIDPASNCPSYVNEWMLDSPAGLPDGQGGLDYPPPANRQPEQMPSSGSFVQQVYPGIYRTVAFPIAPEIANAIQFPVPPGETAPPPPKYCRVPVELIPSTPGAQELLFIAPPPVAADAAEAENYARSRNLAFLPTIDCTPDLLSAPSFGPAVLTAFISSPVPGQMITEPVPIMGTAQFTPEQAAFYKLEIIGGQFSNWVTIGDTRSNPVVNGQLEVLPGPPGLQPGSYRLRLVIIGVDGNVVQTPYEVPFTVP
ncbi:MAG: transglycosylase domain-containing protein [Phototrophicaceae bacterium]